ncbi:hypothetical protein KGQ34_00995 [Patescibacteria group bacterium]|nr:hypothetical protein [Patescibacteria group bacterium]
MSGLFSLIIVIIVGFVALNFLGIVGGGTQGPIATGPGQSSEIKNPQPINISGGGASQKNNNQQGTTQSGAPGDSPYKKLVRIDNIQRNVDSPDKEYITLRSNNPSQNIIITGWTVESRYGGTMTIPPGRNIPEIDAVDSPIILPPGSAVSITTGNNNYPYNFRENGCTAYFNQNQTFAPGISNSCYGGNDYSATELLNRGFNSECVDYIRSLNSCRIPNIPFDTQLKIKDACVQFVTDNISYSGCVARWRDTKDFLKNAWHIFMRRTSNFWDARHDYAVLRDQNGLIVDEFSY